MLLTHCSKHVTHLDRAFSMMMGTTCQRGSQELILNPESINMGEFQISPIICHLYNIPVGTILSSSRNVTGTSFLDVCLDGTFQGVS